jgi:2-oxoisovalerate dehydrogenase E1 component
MEQMVECSHDYWRSNGAFAPNILVRLASGGYIGGGLYHSQNIEASLAPLPGIRIVSPSFADDAAGLIRTAMRSKGVTVYLEPKALYNAKHAMAVIPEDFEVPFGVGRVRREGSDLSIITYGNTVHHSLEAAEKLAEDGYDVEVFDLRSIAPLDVKGIINSVSKTNRVLVAHEDKVFAGFGGEIVSVINEQCFEMLDAPVRRVGSEFTPVGFNRILEKAVLPNTQKLYDAALNLLEY